MSKIQSSNSVFQNLNPRFSRFSSTWKSRIKFKSELKFDPELHTDLDNFRESIIPKEAFVIRNLDTGEEFDTRNLDTR